jgi:hypothetical protein
MKRGLISCVAFAVAQLGAPSNAQPRIRPACKDSGGFCTKCLPLEATQKKKGYCADALEKRNSLRFVPVDPSSAILPRQRGTLSLVPKGAIDSLEDLQRDVDFDLRSVHTLRKVMSSRPNSIQRPSNTRVRIGYGRTPAQAADPKNQRFQKMSAKAQRDRIVEALTETLARHAVDMDVRVNPACVTQSFPQLLSPLPAYGDVSDATLWRNPMKWKIQSCEQYALKRSFSTEWFREAAETLHVRDVWALASGNYPVRLDRRPKALGPPSHDPKESYTPPQVRWNEMAVFVVNTNSNGAMVGLPEFDAKLLAQNPGGDLVGWTQHRHLETLARTRSDAELNRGFESLTRFRGLFALWLSARWQYEDYRCKRSKPSGAGVKVTGASCDEMGQCHCEMEYHGPDLTLPTINTMLDILWRKFWGVDPLDAFRAHANVVKTLSVLAREKLATPVGRAPGVSVGGAVSAPVARSMTVKPKGVKGRFEKPPTVDDYCRGDLDTSDCRKLAGALVTLEGDLRRLAAREARLGALGCLHPDPNRNVCNWSYSAFAAGAIKWAFAARQRHYADCTRFVPDICALSDRDKKIKLLLAKKVFATPDNVEEKLYKEEHAQNIAKTAAFIANVRTAPEKWAKYYEKQEKQFKQKQKDYQAGCISPLIGKASNDSIPYGSDRVIGQEWQRSLDDGNDLFGAKAELSVGMSITAKDNKDWTSIDLTAVPYSEISACDSKADCSTEALKGACFTEPQICSFEGALSLSSSAKVSVFGLEKSLFDLSFDSKLPDDPGAKNKVVASIKVRGNAIYSSQDDSVTFTYPVTPQAEFAKASMTFWAGPVPISVSAGAVASAGFEIASSGTGKSCGNKVTDSPSYDLRAHAKPYVRADAFAQGGVDLWVVSAGVRAALNLISISVPAALAFRVEKGNVALSGGTELAIDALAGSVSLYAEIDYLFDSETWEVPLFSWNGLHWKKSLWSMNVGFPLRALSLRYNGAEPPKIKVTWPSPPPK